MAEQLVQDAGLVGYLETSAKSGENVQYVFGLITQKMIEMRQGT